MERGVGCRLVAIHKDWHVLWIGQWRLREVNVQLLGRDEEVDVIWRAGLQPFKQLQEREGRFAHDKRPNGCDHLGIKRRARNTQVVFQKTEITLVNPVNLGR